MERVHIINENYRCFAILTDVTHSSLQSITTILSMSVKFTAAMAGNINRSREYCSRTSILNRILWKVCSVVAVIVVSFLGGYLLNSVYSSNNQEKEAKIHPNEQRSARRVSSEVRTQLLNSFKAESLEKNSR